MSLRYTDRPYGGQDQPKEEDWRTRFPQGAQPIASAPTQASEPVWIFEPNGAGHLAIHYKGAWQKLAEYSDDRDGSIEIRAMGETVADPVMWAPQGRRRR
jgi:hypothetical protein